MCIQDSIQKMEEYNLGMKNAVQLWDATAAAAGGLLRQPHSKARHVTGGCRPLTGSEARTLIARCAAPAFPCICALLVSASIPSTTVILPVTQPFVPRMSFPSVAWCCFRLSAHLYFARLKVALAWRSHVSAWSCPPELKPHLQAVQRSAWYQENTPSVQNCTR